MWCESKWTKTLVGLCAIWRYIIRKQKNIVSYYAYHSFHCAANPPLYLSIFMKTFTFDVLSILSLVSLSTVTDFVNCLLLAVVSCTLCSSTIHLSNDGFEEKDSDCCHSSKTEGSVSVTSVLQRSCLYISNLCLPPSSSNSRAGQVSSTAHHTKMKLVIQNTRPTVLS